MWRFCSDESLTVMRMAEAQVIPARDRPLRHCVCLAHGFVRVTDPFSGPCQRRFARADRLVIVQQRRHQGPLLLVQGAVFTSLPNNRKGLTPITLARE